MLLPWKLLGVAFVLRLHPQIKTVHCQNFLIGKISIHTVLCKDVEENAFTGTIPHLLEKWFPLLGERGHSSYFLFKKSREEGETE